MQVDQEGQQPIPVHEQKNKHCLALFGVAANTGDQAGSRTQLASHFPFLPGKSPAHVPQFTDFAILQAHAMLQVPAHARPPSSAMSVFQSHPGSRGSSPSVDPKKVLVCNEGNLRAQGDGIGIVVQEQGGCPHSNLRLIWGGEI